MSATLLLALAAWPACHAWGARRLDVVAVHRRPEGQEDPR